MKIISCLVIASLIFCPGSALVTPVRAQGAPGAMGLPTLGTRITPSPAFVPARITGIKVYPQEPFRLDFIVDAGQSGLADEALRAEGARLINYFLTALTIPARELWVNLSPYERERMIPDQLAATEMGRDLLSQDYVLKQLTASLIYPEEDLGREFWDQMYAQARALYGKTTIPINTFNKVWIIPETAVVHENGAVAFIADSHLKVMVDSDYQAMMAGSVSLGQTPGAVAPPEAGLQSALLRDLILPAIEREVNEGKNFARLRQIYHSMILATWYKRNLRESLLARAYADQNKVRGVDLEDPAGKEVIYQQYLAAFTKGVYDYIREDVDQDSGRLIVRKYFAGGIQAEGVGQVVKGQAVSDAEMSQTAHPRSDAPLNTFSTSLAVIHNKILLPLPAIREIQRRIDAMIAEREGQDNIDILVVLDGPSGFGKSTLASVMAEHFAIDGFLVEEGVFHERRFGKKGRIIVRESRSGLTTRFYDERKDYEERINSAASLWIYMAGAKELAAVKAGHHSAADRADLVIDYSDRPDIDQVIAAWQAITGEGRVDEQVYAALAEAGMSREESDALVAYTENFVRGQQLFFAGQSPGYLARLGGPCRLGHPGAAVAAERWADQGNVV